MTVAAPDALSFANSRGEVYDLSLTLYHAKQLEGTDLTSIGIDKPLSMLNTDQLVEQLYINTAYQMALVFFISRLKSPELKEERFFSGLDGAAVQRAREALFEAIEDFFPERRTWLSGIRQRTLARLRMIETKGTAMDLSLDPMYEAEIDKTLQAMQVAIPVEFAKIGQTAIAGMRSTVSAGSSVATGVP